ncbi:MAG: FtsX-like permease family protein, partial [Acidobacteriota bacterium]
EILEKVSDVVERLGAGVRMLGSLTVLAGLAILIGAIAAGASQRGAEVALLKTLGMTRHQVAAAFATEYALVGMIAGVIGTIGGGILAWAVLVHGMDITWSPRGLDFIIALTLAIVLSVCAGLAASVRALAQRPIEVLRNEG